MAILFGRVLVTDWEPLQAMLEALGKGDPGVTSESLEAAFPGIRETVVECFRDLDRKRARASHVTYFSFRFQAWASKFDVEPSEARRLLPAGVVSYEDVRPLA